MKVSISGDLPEGAIENGAIALFQYLTPEGGLYYCMSHKGDVPLSAFVGLLEMGKLDLIELAKEEWASE